MDTIKSKFSIQLHTQKKNRSTHFDLRILDPKKKFLWSWAIPKKKFPSGHEKVLALRTINHKVSYMYFHGKLSNGDTVELYDSGECDIVIQSQNLIVLNLVGKKVNGVYNFVRMVNSKNSWLVMVSKKM